jgi:chromosome condensin MukBEF ATPase and DNA-binding subunit MukB
LTFEDDKRKEFLLYFEAAQSEKAQGDLISKLKKRAVKAEKERERARAEQLARAIDKLILYISSFLPFFQQFSAYTCLG